MQRNTKLTLIITGIAVVFIALFVAIVYQYILLNDLQSQLEQRTASLNTYNQLYSQTMQEIQEVQSDSYIERWARSVLGWVCEGETKIVL